MAYCCCSIRNRVFTTVGDYRCGLTIPCLYCISIEMSTLREIDTKNHTCCFLNDVISIKIFDPDKIKIDEKSDNNMLFHYIFYNILFLLVKAKTHWESIKKYGTKSMILSDQQIITLIILIKNIWKSNSIQMMIYLWKEH